MAGSSIVVENLVEIVALLASHHDGGIGEEIEIEHVVEMAVREDQQIDIGKREPAGGQRLEQQVAGHAVTDIEQRPAPSRLNENDGRYPEEPAPEGEAGTGGEDVEIGSGHEEDT
ncbi:hypothetical protein [Breoghania sp.]|uniref:hypothetical protein n=1 Tax=Breoghania sp. TaxID=2065378 RepID=UPI00261102BC|nr:hypothetical protein [Breoghania sp.]MDJ0931137.1 hypothetical protein [Breoghania sp.]